MCTCFSCIDGCQLYHKNKAIITSHVILINKIKEKKVHFRKNLTTKVISGKV